MSRPATASPSEISLRRRPPPPAQPPIRLASTNPVVHYKFKSSAEVRPRPISPDLPRSPMISHRPRPVSPYLPSQEHRIVFSTPDVSVGQLKAAILAEQRMQTGGWTAKQRRLNRFSLELSHAQTGATYADDSTPVPSHTAVVVRRVPAHDREPIHSARDAPPEMDKENQASAPAAAQMPASVSKDVRLGRALRFAVLDCPKPLVGRVIGRGGENVHVLEYRSGTKIQIDQRVPPGAPCRVRITGPPEKVAACAQMVEAVMTGTTVAAAVMGVLGGTAGGGMSPAGAEHEAAPTATPPQDPAGLKMQRLVEHVQAKGLEQVVAERLPPLQPGEPRPPRPAAATASMRPLTARTKISAPPPRSVSSSVVVEACAVGSANGTSDIECPPAKKRAIERSVSTIDESIYGAYWDRF